MLFLLLFRREYVGHGTITDSSNNIFVILVGGAGDPGTFYDNVDKYDVQNDSWESMNPYFSQTTAVSGLSFMEGGKRRLLMSGGLGFTQIYEYHVDSDSWSLVADYPAGGTDFDGLTTILFNK